MRRNRAAWIGSAAVAGVAIAIIGASDLWKIPTKGTAGPRVQTEVTTKGGGPDQAGERDGAPPEVAASERRRTAFCADAHRVVCGTPWPSVDPTGRVLSDVTGEVRALRLMRKLVRENPAWTSESLQERLAESIYTQPRRHRVEEAFAWVMVALRRFIEEQPDATLSRGERKAILKRLSKVSLELPPPASVYADAADLITKNTVYYERTPKGKLRLRLGGAYLLGTTSWYNIVFTLAHELAHVIDPCEARHARIVPRAYARLMECFVDRGWVESGNLQCGPDDQVSEVFADWVAAQIVGTALAAVERSYEPVDRVNAAVNAVRDLCIQHSSLDSLDLRSHQRPEIRIGSIFGLHPEVRRPLGCTLSSERVSYCQFQPPRPLAERKGEKL